MKNQSLNLNGIKQQFTAVGSQLKRYRAFIFFLVVAAVYGFILWRINVYSNTPASQSETQTITATQPHIDQATVDKIQSLQDNSVSVQALFNQARQDPFNE